MHAGGGQIRTHSPASRTRYVNRSGIAKQGPGLVVGHPWKWGGRGLATEWLDFGCLLTIHTQFARHVAVPQGHWKSALANDARFTDDKSVGLKHWRGVPNATAGPPSGGARSPMSRLGAPPRIQLLGVHDTLASMSSIDYGGDETVTVNGQTERNRRVRCQGASRQTDRSRTRNVLPDGADPLGADLSTMGNP